jgi:hypothetical protein
LPASTTAKPASATISAALIRSSQLIFHDKNDRPPIC